MAGFKGQPAAGYKFNTFNEIKSHSSILYNERMAILFYLLDMKSINLNSGYQINDMLEVKSILTQIYKNVRTLLRNNPTVRATLNLETKDMGVYTTDIAFDMIEKMVRYCEAYGYTTKRIYIITQELNKVEMLLKDVLQYFHYFIRPDFRQKPDIELATEGYKEIADKKTVQELKQIVGKRHSIDFQSLGTKRVQINSEIEYDETIDGELEEEKENST
jgi:hypothetical protein